MAMSNTMIYEGNAARAHLKSEVKITTGLGFMDNVIFDSHFEKGEGLWAGYRCARTRPA
ncbi:MAG: hypothetical protein IPH68_11520 [Chitinophagaceae bacterium]|nr:hypothetical protein [Chitinophagaceae bacterium]